jgi:hypothetical protein
MGRVALIWVLIGSLSLAIIGLGMRARSNDAFEAAVTYFAKHKVKDIAASVTEMYVRKLAEGSVSAPNSYTVPSVMGGVATVDLFKVSSDTVLIRTLGTYTSYSDSAKAYCVSSGGVPLITGAFGISRTSTNSYLKITGAGSIIDGRNYDPVTGLLDPSVPSVDGITAANQSDYTTLGFKSVLGKKGGPTPPDTAWVGAGQPDYDYLPGLLIPKATRVVNVGPSSNVVWGTWSNPEITVVNDIGSCSKTISGCGILIFTGSTSFTAPLTWTGLILVASTPTLQAYFKPTQVNSFYGAILMCGPNPKWDQSNNGFYNYSQGALKHVFGNVGLGGGYQVAYWWE